MLSPFFCVLFCTIEAQEEWLPIGDVESLISYNAIAFNGSQFLAAGEGESFALSRDGIKWEADQIAVNNQPGFSIFRITSSSLGWHALNNSLWGKSFMHAQEPSDWAGPEFTSSINYLDAAHGNGFQLILRSGGRVFQIPDGTDGGPFNRIPNSQAIAIAFGNGRFVACGGYGTVSTSVDGLNWTVRPTGLTSDLKRVIYANNEFVIVGYDGTILRSPDGIEWETVRSGGEERFFDVASFKDYYYILAHSGGGIYRSDRQGNVIDLCLLGGSLKAIAASDERIVIAGGSGFLTRSSDGEHWYNNFNSRSGTGADQYAFLDGKGVVAYHSIRGLEFSTDLLTWRSSSIGGGRSLPFTHKSDFYRRSFIDTNFYRSEKGGSWELATDIPPLEGNITHLVSVNETLFAFENGKLLHMLSPSSGWLSPDQTVEGIAYSLQYENDLYTLATEMTSPDLQSVDGLTWSNRVSPGEQAIDASFAFFQGKYFSLINKRLNYSLNGDDWMPVEEEYFTQNSDPYFRFFQFESDLFLADWKGNLYATADGENWTESRVLRNDPFGIENVIEFEGRILAIATRGQIYEQPTTVRPDLQVNFESGPQFQMEASVSDPSRHAIYLETSYDLEHWQEMPLLPQEGSETVQAMLDLEQDSSSKTQFHRIATGPSLDFSGIWTGTLETETVSDGDCANQFIESERLSYMLNWLADDRILIDQLQKAGELEYGVFTGSIISNTLDIEMERTIASACQDIVECEVSITGTSESGLEMIVRWTEQVCGEENCLAFRTLTLNH